MCSFIALIPLLLLPIIPTRVAAIMHLALMAPLTSYQLLLFAWRKRSMAIDVIMSFACIVFGGAAAILFLMSQQTAAHACIGNALCTAALHMLLMSGATRIVRSDVCAFILALLGGGGMISPSPFIAQRMFQCAAFPLMVMVFELTNGVAEAATVATTSGRRLQPTPFLSLRGPIPDFFTANKKTMLSNKKDCDIFASGAAATVHHAASTHFVDAMV